MKIRRSTASLILVGLIVNSSSVGMPEVQRVPSRIETNRFQKFYNAIRSYRPLTRAEAKTLWEWGTLFVQRQSIDPMLSQKVAKIGKKIGLTVGALLGIVVFFLGAKWLLTGPFPDVSNVLIQAAKKGDKETVNFLLSLGMNINAQDSLGDTALMKATVAGYKDIVDLLLQRGAQIDVRNRGGKTALLLAATFSLGKKGLGKKGIVALLLDNNADINAQDSLGDTALMKATVAGYKDIVDLLLQRGADKHIKNNQEKTAADLALNPQIKKMISGHKHN